MQKLKNEFRKLSCNAKIKQYMQNFGIPIDELNDVTEYVVKKELKGAISNYATTCSVDISSYSAFIGK